MANKKEATLILRIKSTGAKAIKGIGGSLKSIGSLALKSAGLLAGLTAGVFKFAQMGEKFNEVKKSFESLAQSQGQNAKEMLANLRETTKGTISDMELMQKANNALLLGLPVERFGEMAQIARAASKATGESMEFMLQSIVTGLGRGSKLILDNLGIVVNTEKAYEKYAATLGKTATQLTDAEKKTAFINDAMRIGLDNANKMGAGAISLNDRWARFTATAQNTAITIGQNLTPVLGILFDSMERVATAATSLIGSFSTAGGFEWITQAVSTVINKIELLGDVGGAVLGTVFGAVTQAMEGNFKQAFESIKSGFTDLPKVIEENTLRGQQKAAEIEEQFAAKRAETRKKDVANLRSSLAQQRSAIEEDHSLKRDMEALNNEIKMEDELLYDELRNEAKFQRQLESIDQEIANEEDKVARIQLLKQKQLLIEKGIDDKRKQQMTAMQQFEAFLQSERVKGLQGTLNHISSLQDSKNKEMIILGKAAAIASITISTAQAAMDGYKWGTKFGGPGLGASFAALAIAAGAVQAARVAGVQLAEGGIVRATPGGVQATIGEGGQDEAVIPLDDDRAAEALGGMGGGNTFNFNGPVMGDKSQAREFAIAMDAELTALRRDGESTAFDEDIT